MKLKRFIVSMLAICLLLSLLPLGSAFAAEIGSHKSAPAAVTTQKAGETVTRAEWISGLVDAYHLDEQVSDESLPDNYYPDISENASYYRDILVAVYAGMVDVEPGDPFRPEDALSRDFAVFSLNLLTAIQPNTSSYAFSDASSVSHPSSAQVAVEQNWLGLVSGRFMPSQAVTKAEAETMLQAAKARYSATQIDQDYKNSIQFKSMIKVIPVGSAVTQKADGSILFSNCPVTIQKGDTIAFYLGDIPSVYAVDSVSVNGQQTTVTGTPQTLSSAVLDIDMQGEFDVGLEYARPLDGSDLYYVMKSGEETQDQAVALAYSKDLSEIRGEKDLNLGGGVKLHVSFSMPSPTLKYNLEC